MSKPMAQEWTEEEIKRDDEIFLSNFGKPRKSQLKSLKTEPPLETSNLASSPKSGSDPESPPCQPA